MNLEKILAYQEQDLALRNLELQIEKSKDYAIAEKAKENFLKLGNIAKQTEKVAGDLYDRYKKLESFANGVNSKLEELEKVLEMDLSEKNIEKIDDQIKKLQSNLSALEKELQRMPKNIDETLKRNEEARKEGANMRHVFNEAKQRFDALKDQIAPKIQEYKTKLAELAKGIDKDLFAKYQSLRKDKVLPAIVKAVDGGNCGGCGMQLSAAAVTKLKEKGIIECESCRRIIYLEE
ncbi:MAG TPA: C4-type zinc ribbon domain-containing protein [Clostridia bacterium]